MNLEGILSISGKPGLYKLVSQSKNTLIVEGYFKDQGLKFLAKDSEKLLLL